MENIERKLIHNSICYHLFLYHALNKVENWNNSFRRCKYCIFNILSFKCVHSGFNLLNTSHNKIKVHVRYFFYVDNNILTFYNVLRENLFRILNVKVLHIYSEPFRAEKSCPDPDIGKRLMFLGLNNSNQTKTQNIVEVEGVYYTLNILNYSFIWFQCVK